MGNRLTPDLSVVSCGEGTLALHTRSGIHEEPGASFSASALWILWVSVTMALVVVALIVARLATAALDDAARMPTSSPGGTVLIAAILVVGLPGAAVLAFMSGLGFVLGFLILLVVVPALTFVG